MVKKVAQLAAGLALASGVSYGWAQIANPNDMVTGPPKPPPVRQRSKGPSSASLQWLWKYTEPAPNGNAVALRGDERFAALLGASFKQSQAMWGRNVPVSEVIPRFLARYGEVNAKGNRYMSIDGCVPSFCAAHGMLWVDLGTVDPLMMFVAVDWTTEGHTTDEPNADYNLWLYPNHEVSSDALPLAMTEAVSDWDARLASAHRSVPHVAHAVLVEPNGQTFPLSPTLVGANTLPPQPDTVTPRTSDEN